MSLAPGARLGPYQILAAIGAGGMGEVYRARDTRLDRTVAIKVLAELLAADGQLRERFDREARAISQLTHPHICTLHDIGEHEGTAFLVMELLDGETLAARLEKGALKLDDALRIAIEIAGALEVAHRSGIVHRDLKPGNVMLTRTGAKLLDFGLAKARAPAVAVAGDSRLPTTPPSLTAQGTILGTIQYMAPEQIEGEEADARTDLFAFGCVLHEMLTGRRAFEGQTRASLIAAIMHVDPPLVSTTRPAIPRALDRVVKKCLAKDADDRWQSARDLRDELQWIAEPSAVATDAKLTNVAHRANHRLVSWALASALGLALGVAVVLLLWAPWRNAPPAAPMRLSTYLGVMDASLVTTQGAAAILSPDANIIAFVAQQGARGGPQLYVRRLNQLEAEPLLGTNDADSPFFSPDGQWIAFFAGGKLKKIAVAGGAAVILCDAPVGRGGSWGEDGTIVFAVYSPDIAVTLLRVSSAGGTPEPVTSLAEREISHRWPQFLPGAKAILYTASHGTGGHDDADLVVQVLATGVRKIVQRSGYYGRFLASGHLVYVRDATLFAVPFDLDRLEVTGQSVPVLEGVTTNSVLGGAQFDVSVSSTLVYVPGQSISGGLPIHWMDQAGKTTPLRATPANWLNPHFAPDGRRLALEVVSGQADVWIYEWARDTFTRLTLDPASDQKPVWTPDGRRIAFASARADQLTSNLYWQQVDGTTEGQRLTESSNSQLPGSWHPNGKLLAFEEQTSPTNYDLMILTMEGDDALGWKPGKPNVFLNTPFIEREPMFSPDGRWLAYVSNETERNEVFVRPFPGPGGKWQISTGGGNYPTWSHTKPELLYGFNGQIMVAPFTVEAGSFRAEKSRLWSDGRFVARGLLRAFDLHPDGERFALAPVAQSQGGEKRDHVTFIFNFFEELRRLAPQTKR